MKRTAAVFAALALALAGVTLAPAAAFAATDVSGTITEADGTTPIPGAAISFQVSNGSVNAYADGSGHFAIATLSPGNYTVQFSATGFASEYYNDTYLTASAATVTVADGVPLVLDASLEVESTISGTITDYNNAPVVGAHVWVITENNGWNVVGGATTSATGTYAIGQLAPGNARVYVQAAGSSVLQTTWYTSGYSQATATTFAIPAAGGTATVDIQMPLGATIQGTVVDPIGTPVDLRVDAAGAGLDYSSTVSTNVGAYAINGLHPQGYTVTTHDPDGLFADAAPQAATGVAGTPANVDFVVTPALVNESLFIDQLDPVSGPTTVQAGKTYTWVVDANGNIDVYAILYSSPVYLGAATRNPDNSATLTLTIPSNTPAGVHRFTYSSANVSKQGTSVSRQYFFITVTAAAPLAATGVNAAPLVAGGLLSLLIGTLALLYARRSSRR